MRLFKNPRHLLHHLFHADAMFPQIPGAVFRILPLLDRLQEMYPGAEAVLTLGSGGSVYQDGKQRIRQGIFPVQVADTTAAGDTFTGYFLTSRMEGRSAEECLRRASRAAAIAVSRAGAAQSIPEREEVDAFTISEEVSGYCFTRQNQSRE